MEKEQADTIERDINQTTYQAKLLIQNDKLIIQLEDKGTHNLYENAFSIDEIKSLNKKLYSNCGNKIETLKKQLLKNDFDIEQKNLSTLSIKWKIMLRNKQTTEISFELNQKEIDEKEDINLDEYSQLNDEYFIKYECSNNIITISVVEKLEGKTNIYSSAFQFDELNDKDIYADLFSDVNDIVGYFEADIEEKNVKCSHEIENNFDSLKVTWDILLLDDDDDDDNNKKEMVTVLKNTKHKEKNNNINGKGVKEKADEDNIQLNANLNINQEKNNENIQLDESINNNNNNKNKQIINFGLNNDEDQSKEIKTYTNSTHACPPSCNVSSVSNFSSSNDGASDTFNLLVQNLESHSNQFNQFYYSKPVIPSNNNNIKNLYKQQKNQDLIQAALKNKNENVYIIPYEKDIKYINELKQVKEIKTKTDDDKISHIIPLYNFDEIKPDRICVCYVNGSIHIYDLKTYKLLSEPTSNNSLEIKSIFQINKSTLLITIYNTSIQGWYLIENDLQKIDSLYIDKKDLLLNHKNIQNLYYNSQMNSSQKQKKYEYDEESTMSILEVKKDYTYSFCKGLACKKNKNNNLFITSAQDGWIELWEVNWNDLKINIVKSIKTHGWGAYVNFIELFNGCIATSCNEDKTIYFIDIYKNQIIEKMENINICGNQNLFEWNNFELFVCCIDAISVIDYKNYNVVKVIDGLGTGFIWSIEYIFNTKNLIIKNHCGVLYLFDMENKKIMNSNYNNNNSFNAYFTYDEGVITGIENDNKVLISYEKSFKIYSY